MAQLMINGHNLSSGYITDEELNSTSINPVQNKVITEELNKKLNSTDIADWAKTDTKPEYTYTEVGADPVGSASAAKKEANTYTDESIAALINGAPTTLDTLKEIADAMAENENVVDALETAIGTKANANEHNIKTYRTIQSLGLTTPTTVAEIFAATPIGSIVHIGCEGASAITGLPVNTGSSGYGILEINKEAAGRFSIVYKVSLQGSAALNYMYIGQCAADGSDFTWSRLVRDGDPIDIVSDQFPQIGITNNTNSAAIHKNNQALALINYCDEDKSVRRDLYVYGTETQPNIANALKFGTNESGSWKYYNLYGTHNLSTATTSTAGLESAADKTKLDATNIAYGTCSTAAATAAKVITISGNTNWKLAAGSMITVKFTNTNTAQNPTFNVNNTGAKKVWYNTALITKNGLGYAGTANRLMNFIYDGTQYVFIGWSLDNNTTYSYATTTANGLVKLSNNTTIGPLGWDKANGTLAVTTNSLAFWDGRYNDETSNLAYCKKGAFGDIVTENKATFNAATATTATNVKATGVAPTTATSYFPIVVDSSSTTTSNEALKTHNNMRCSLLQGTAGTEGYAHLVLGNDTAKGTAGNSKGGLIMYGSNAGYVNLQPSNPTSKITVTLPSTGGTLALNTAASASAAGLVSTGAQTFAGAKTFNGVVDCNGASAVGTAQARNIYAGTTDMTAGTSKLETGAIYIVYE